MAGKFLSGVLHGADKAITTLSPLVEKGVGVFAPELLPEYELAKAGYSKVRNTVGNIEKQLGHQSQSSHTSIGKITTKSKTKGTHQLLSHVKEKALSNIPTHLRRDVVPAGIEAAKKMIEMGKNEKVKFDPTKMVEHSFHEKTDRLLKRNLPEEISRVKDTIEQFIPDTHVPGKKYSKSGYQTHQPIPFMSSPAGNDLSLNGGHKPGNVHVLQPYNKIRV